MELIPDLLVAGATPLPTSPEPISSAERINRVWADLAPRFGLTGLQLAPTRDAANFTGAAPDEGVTIQPTVLQFRERIRTTVEDSHRRAHEVLRTISRQLGPHQLLNLGIRHIYRVPMPNNDARGFILNQLLTHGGEALADLTEGADTWGGVKYVMTRHVEPVTFTLQVEPLQRDDMRSLYVDLDAQYPGTASLDAFLDRASDGHRYVTGAVNRYLDRLVGNV
jgi:hypothetical protein